MSLRSAITLGVILWVGSVSGASDEAPLTEAVAGERRHALRGDHAVPVAGASGAAADRALGMPICEP